MRGGLAACQSIDQARPVGLTVLQEFDHDSRMIERDVGYFDATDQQREEPQARGQPLGHKGGLLGVAKCDIGEVHVAAREQRNAGFSPQDRIKASYLADLRQNPLAHSVGGYEISRGRQHGQTTRDDREQNKSQAFQAGSRRQRGGSGYFGVWSRRTIASVPRPPTWMASVTLSRLRDQRVKILPSYWRSSAISAIIFLTIASPNELKSFASSTKLPGPPMTLSR